MNKLLSFFRLPGDVARCLEYLANLRRDHDELAGNVQHDVMNRLELHKRDIADLKDSLAVMESRIDALQAHDVLRKSSIKPVKGKPRVGSTEGADNE